MPFACTRCWPPSSIYRQSFPSRNTAARESNHSAPSAQTSPALGRQDPRAGSTVDPAQPFASFHPFPFFQGLTNSPLFELAIPFYSPRLDPTFSSLQRHNPQKLSSTIHASLLTL
ncbi:hypothetical protein LZ31DRAFT_550449 [Colletotrichum somersetense]|nr:hypothetical protein LZ31DRAFT_550449 [Colletotrichum somersetense]